MIYLYFLEDDLSSITTFFGIFTILCVVVIIAVFIDLGFGIYESKKEGSFTHSAGLRRTVNKLATYLAFIFLAFFLDAVNPVFVYINAPELPLLTIAITMFLIVIELLSIREHASKGIRKKFREAPAEMRVILKDIKEIKNDLKDIAKND